MTRKAATSATERDVHAQRLLGAVRDAVRLGDELTKAVPGTPIAALYDSDLAHALAVAEESRKAIKDSKI